jgi:hypothetical protein
MSMGSGTRLTFSLDFALNPICFVSPEHQPLSIQAQNAMVFFSGSV